MKADKKIENYNLIFFPNGITIDKKFDVKEYQKEIKNNKYDRREKSKLLSFIINSNDLENVNFINKMKKILPNGFNKFHSIEDTEYENLQKEFEKMN